MNHRIASNRKSNGYRYVSEELNPMFKSISPQPVRFFINKTFRKIQRHQTLDRNFRLTKKLSFAIGDQFRRRFSCECKECGMKIKKDKILHKERKLKEMKLTTNRDGQPRGYKQQNSNNSARLSSLVSGSFHLPALKRPQTKSVQYTLKSSIMGEYQAGNVFSILSQNGIRTRQNSETITIQNSQPNYQPSPPGSPNPLNSLSGFRNSKSLTIKNKLPYSNSLQVSPKVERVSKFNQFSYLCNQDSRKCIINGSSKIGSSKLAISKQQAITIAIRSRIESFKLKNTYRNFTKLVQRVK